MSRQREYYNKQERDYGSKSGSGRGMSSRYEREGNRPSYFDTNINNLKDACRYLDEKNEFDMKDVLCILGLIKYQNVQIRDLENNNILRYVRRNCGSTFRFDEVNYVDTYIRNYIEHFTNSNQIKEKNISLIDRFGNLPKLINRLTRCFEGSQYTFNLGEWSNDIKEPRIASVIFRGELDNPQILLVRQSAWDPQYSKGQLGEDVDDIKFYYYKYGLPKGGMKEIFDNERQKFVKETPEQTIERELKEEIGLDIHPLLENGQLLKIDEIETSKFIYLIYQLKDDILSDEFSVDKRGSDENEKEIDNLRREIYPLHFGYLNKSLTKEDERLYWSKIDQLKGLLNNREIDFSEWYNLNTLKDSDEYKIFGNRSIKDLMEIINKIVK